MINKWVSRIILLLLYYLQIFRFFAYLDRKKIVVLVYHGITKDDLEKRNATSNFAGLHLHTEKFKQQMKYLSTKYNIISLDSLVSAIVSKTELSPYSAVVTFDDGYVNNYTNAFPVLKSLKIPATIFLVTSFVGTEKVFWWDRIKHAIMNTKLSRLKIPVNGKETTLNLKNIEDKKNAITYVQEHKKTLKEEEGNRFIEEVIGILGVESNVISREDEDYKIIDWDKVREMKRYGISFGSHTANHVILTNCNDAQVEGELRESKRKIEAELDEECKLFAYPNGNFNKKTKDIVAKVGYLCAVSGLPGLNSLQKIDLYVIKRVGISSTDSFVHFLGKICGVYFFLSNLKRKLRKSKPLGT